jgi:hypothetical protein
LKAEIKKPIVIKPKVAKILPLAIPKKKSITIPVKKSSPINLSAKKA